MDFNIIIGIILLLVFIIVPILPLSYLLFKFFQDAIRLAKELRVDYQNISAKIQQEELENYLHKQQQKEQLGIGRYYKEKMVSFFQKYAFCFYVVLVIGILVFFCLGPWFMQSAQPTLPRIEEPKLVSFIFLPIQGIVFFGFICSKNEKRKWQWAAGLAGIFTLELLWGLLIERSAFALEKVFIIVLSLGLVMYYYQQWKQKSDEQLLLLQERLRESNFTSDILLQQYNCLQEQRHDTKKHFSVLRYLAQEQELKAIQNYVERLEQNGREQQNETK